jgi:hypothetical protein
VGTQVNVCLDKLLINYIRTSSESDAGLYKIYWPTGLRYSAHTGGFLASRLLTHLMTVLVGKRDSAYTYLILYLVTVLSL